MPRLPHAGARATTTSAGRHAPPVVPPGAAGGAYVQPGPVPNGYPPPVAPSEGRPRAGTGPGRRIHRRGAQLRRSARRFGTAGQAGPGGVSRPPACLDPYAAPGGCPQPLLPQDPYCPGRGPEFSMGLMQKFIQHVDLDFEWFAGNGDHELGIDNVGLSCTFAFPCSNVATPLLVTPGFAVHYWSGPVSVPGPPPPADLPPRTYDAYIDTAWNPWFDASKTFGAELDFRIGMYSDFNIVTTESMRFMGRAEGVLPGSPTT